MGVTGESYGAAKGGREIAWLGLDLDRDSCEFWGQSSRELDLRRGRVSVEVKSHI